MRRAANGRRASSEREDVDVGAARLSPSGWSKFSFAFLAALTGLLAPAFAQSAPSSPPSAVYFATDVVPLLTKYGCNGGGCHGKATGQNGFRLSLLGYEPDFDHEALVREARGRRISLAAPRQSLLLLKATASVPHGGGQRIAADSDDYQVLARWIERGAPAASPADPVLERITVDPRRHTFGAADRRRALRVVAHFSNGSSREVTRQAVYQTNEPELAEVSETGVVDAKKRSGLFAVMVRYGDQIGLFDGAVPAPHANSRAVAELEEWSRLYGGSRIDRQLVEQWRRLGLAPSAFASDSEFIRRASLDICGTLPTPAEVEAYVADSASDKRARLIDRLLERPEYASYFALKWADILRNRGRGYSTSKQRHGTALFAGWIRDSLAANMPYDQFATAILTASGSQQTNPPTVWYRSVRTTPDYVESVAQAFLGVRIQCAQCHHHPAERWGQDDYYGLAAVFARVGRKGGFADAEVPTNESIYLADEGRTVHPRTGHVMAPRPLGGPDFPLTRYDDPRRSLARWMTSSDNPYFARTLANRMWAHFFGRGIIHPLDDARSTNPPSNPELLDALAEDFLAQRFDVQQLIRTICNSSAYSLSALPNESNRDDTQNFARYYPKRMSAEVLLDALGQVLDAPAKFPNVAGEFPAGTRAIDLPDEAVPSHFLDVFGRPARNSACECERVDAPALGQTLELVSSPEIHQKLTRPGGYVDQLKANGHPPADNVRAIFWRVFARAPRPNELQTAVKFLESKPDSLEAYRSLLWALLATNEFLFNH